MTLLEKFQRSINENVIPMEGFHGAGNQLFLSQIKIMPGERSGYSHQGLEYGGFYITAGTDDKSYKAAFNYAQDSAKRSGASPRIYKISLKPGTNIVKVGGFLGAPRLSKQKIESYLLQGIQALYTPGSLPTPEIVILDRSCIDSFVEV